jgi:hypothetical protein
MKAWWLLMTFIFVSLHVNAQYKFQGLRFYENYEYLKNDTTENWYKKMKFTSFNSSASSYLSQGGEVSYQFQHFTNEDSGESPVRSYNAFYTRFLYHTDFHISKYLRFFNQFNSTFAVGRVTPNRPIDENQLDFQQTFIDVYPYKEITIRVGRQELLYGSQRLIAVREGPTQKMIASYLGITPQALSTIRGKIAGKK